MGLNNTKIKKLIFLQIIIFVLLPLNLFAVSPEDQTKIDLANSLEKQGVSYYEQGNFPEAEILVKRSLSIREKVFGPEHPTVSISLGKLAFLYINQERYAEAEPLYKRSLAILEKSYGPDYPDVATSLNNLALL